MTTISLRLPNAIREAVRKLAKQEGISINQFITLALAEKVAALTTESYLQERAKRGDEAKFRAALAKVPDVPPDEDDEL